MVRLSTIALALASCLPTVLSHPANGPRNSLFGCGTEPSDDFLAKAEELAAVEASRSSNSEEKVAAASNISLSANTLQIQTYFHVVAKSTALSDGYVPSTALAKQLAVMNDNYGMSNELSQTNVHILTLQ